jgi:hypothetical protein
VPLFTTILLLGEKEIRWKKVEDMPIKVRKAGRPRAIPKEVEPVVAMLYDRGYGYRAIARMLNTPDYGVNVHFSSVRKTLIRLGKITVK